MPVQHVKSRPIIIGLTGGIASGKSTATSYLDKKGIAVIDSDRIVKDAWLTNFNMLHDIEVLFHTLDKKVIAEKIFEHDDLRAKLNAIVHPYVFKMIENQLSALRDEDIVVIDMPLLFEVGYEKRVDYTAVIYVSEDEAMKRLMARDQINEETAKKRIHAQMPIDKKKAMADFVLDNMLDKENLYQLIDYMLRSIEEDEE